MTDMSWWCCSPLCDHYKLTVTVYKCLHGLAPPYLAVDCMPVTSLPSWRHLRSAESGCLAVTGTMTTLGSRNSAVTGTKVWNSLPVDLRLLSRSLHTFGHKLKHYLFVSEPWAHLRFFKVALYKFSHYYYCLRWQTVGPALQLLPTNHCPDLPHAHTRWLLLISRPAEGRRLSWLELTMDSTVAPYQGCLQLD